MDRAEALDRLHRACHRVGLDPVGADLLGYSVNAVYRLRSAPVVVRLRGDCRPVVIRTVWTARWLAVRRAPTVRLFGDFPQPVEVDGYTATFWTAVGRPGPRPAGSDLGPPLRALHRLAAPRHLPVWTLFPRIRDKIARADQLHTAERQWLTDECERLEKAYASIVPDLRHGLIHADADVRNVLTDDSGRRVLCDIDTMARGPLLYDLVPTAVHAIRRGRTARYAALSRSYGQDVTRESAWPVLRRIREMELTAAALAYASDEPHAAREALHRLRTLRTGDDAARWHGLGGG